MTSTGVMLLVASCLLCGLAWAMIAYAGVALRRGWPSGEWYAASFSWLHGFAVVAFFGALAFGYLAVGWWGPLVVLALGNIGMRTLFPFARQNTQVIAPIAGLLLSVACISLWLSSGGS